MISAATVKELRERTGVGMMDCKRALEQCEGDMEKAIEFLREKGLATAAKKAGRVAKQGIVFGKTDGRRGALVELNCETDFVAKNEGFQDLGNALVEAVFTSGNNDVTQLLETPYQGSTMQAALTNLIATIGENMAIRRAAFFDAGDNGMLDLYIHGGGRIAAMVNMSVANGNPSEDIQPTAHDISLQIVAAKPVYVASEDIPADVLEAEKQIFHSQAINEGKPENIVPRLVEGRVRKLFEEQCLLDQFFIKDTDISVRTYLQNMGKQLDRELSIVNFVRFEIGETLTAAESAEATEE